MKKFWVRTFRWLALSLAFIVPLRSPRNPPNFSDWNVYIEAGRQMAHGQTVYDVIGHYQYKYAPGVAALFAGLSRIVSSDRLAWVNWTLELGIFVGVCFYLGLSRTVSRSSWKKYFAVLAIIAALAIPLRDELKLGQLNLWAWGFALKAWSDAHRNRLGRGAFFWTAAVSLKLYALVFVPYWIFRKRWKFLASCFVFYFLLNVVSVAFFRTFGGAVQENFAWYRSLTKSSVELVGHVFDVSIFGILRKRDWPAWTGLLLWMLALASYLRESWHAAGRDLVVPEVASRIDPALQRFFGRSLAWILLLNPLVWSYWCVSLVFVLLPSLERPGMFTGSIGVPRRLWILAILFLVGVIHRHNTPFSLGGALTGAVGFLLLTRPSEEGV